MIICFHNDQVDNSDGVVVMCYIQTFLLEDYLDAP